MSDLTAEKPPVIVIDAGGTQTSVGVLSAAGALLPGVRRFETPGPARLPEAGVAEWQRLLFDRLADEVRAIQQRHHELRLQRIGVSFGAVVTNAGIVENASILWHSPEPGFDVAGALRSRLLEMTVDVINDVSAAAWRYREEGRFALITISTGVGAKIFDERLSTSDKLMLDADGLAGEMGHVVVSPELTDAALERAKALAADRPSEYARSLLGRAAPDPSRLVTGDLGAAANAGDALAVEILDAAGVPWCECGNVGDLCAWSSGPAAERLARARGRPMTTREIADAAAAGDPFALRLLDATTARLAMRIAQLCADVGLTKVFITGGFAHGVGEPYFAALRANLARIVHRSGYFTRWSDEHLQALVRTAADPLDDALIGVGRLVQHRARLNRGAWKRVGEARLELRDEERPQCGAEQFVLRVRYAGICSTDLQILRGERPHEPGVLGHECVCKVVEAGPRCPGVRPGQLVALNPNSPLDPWDKIGHNRSGIFQQTVMLTNDFVARGQVIELPEARPEWTLLEPLACVLHAQRRMAESFEGLEVLVAGAGITGLLHVAAARSRGARRVFLANRSASKLAFAVERGVVALDDVLSLDGAAAEVMRKTDGRGVAAVIIAAAGAGGPEVAEAVLPAAAEGGSVCLFGGFAPGAMLRTDGGAIAVAPVRAGAETPRTARGVQLVGSRGSVKSDYELAVALAASGRLDVSRLVTHHISLDALPRVIDELARSGTVAGGAAMRVIIDMALRGDVVQRIGAA